MSARITARTAGSVFVIALFALAFSLTVAVSSTPPAPPCSAAPVIPERHSAAPGGAPLLAAGGSAHSPCDDAAPTARPGDPSRTRDRDQGPSGEPARPGTASRPGGPATAATAAAAAGGTAASGSPGRSRCSTAHAPAVLQVFRC
ncbi:hypothetical protein [Streptomyces wuyuanensis]|uniref:hypothetical protein n=1 Tax=Streptomyces wuyuanensis TaxID=1196353 RepID=UPI003711D79F